MSFVVRSTRRGRSNRSRRRKRVRIILFLLFFLAIASFALLRVTARHASSSDFGLSPEWSHGDASANLAGLAAQSSLGAVPQTARAVYPYSVVPGGVQSAAELKHAGDHDPVVARHYTGFDYKNARVIEVREPRLVYVSYRLHDRIYWTSKQIRLHRGEKLISDGVITARTRCGNRVSETAQKAVAPEEPPAEKFDQPFFADGGSATQAPFPGTFESALKSAPTFDGGGSIGPPITTSYLFGPSGGTGYPPIFPPPLPGGDACRPREPQRIERGSGGPEDKTVHDCPKSPHPGGPPTPPPPVPEPSTILLFSTGAAALYLRYRK